MRHGGVLRLAREQRALELETQGNFVGGAGWVSYAFNNGVAWPGADHVQLGFVWGDGAVH